jgi:hypothetical protein
VADADRTLELILPWSAREVVELADATDDPEARRVHGETRES